MVLVYIESADGKNKFKAISSRVTKHQLCSFSPFDAVFFGGAGGSYASVHLLLDGIQRTEIHISGSLPLSILLGVCQVGTH